MFTRRGCVPLGNGSYSREKHMRNSSSFEIARPLRRFIARIAVTGPSVFCLVAFIAWTANAGNWPQILGPNRNGVAAADERLAPWPNLGGPEVVWQRPVGQGLAGVAVADGRVILFHRQDDREIIAALSASAGELLWETDYPTQYHSGISPDSGPRCVPVIAGNRVVTFGAEGQLTCLDVTTGNLLWSVDTWSEFRPPTGYFGAGNTPIVADGKVIVNVGARGAGIVAFQLASGKVAWQSTDDAASYSAPTIGDLAGEPHLFIVTRLRFLGVDIQSGQLRFQIPFGKRGPTVNGATPIVVDDHVFLTASYEIGATLVQLVGEAARQRWNKSGLLASQYVTPVPQGRTLYGVDGRDDAGRCHLKAFDAMTGEIYWTQHDFGYASLVRAGDKLLLLGTDGGLVLAVADKTAYKELARSRLFDTTTRALPALADGQLYARDTKLLKCVRVGQSTK